MEYTYDSPELKDKEDAIPMIIADNDSSVVRKNSRDLRNALRNLDSAVSAFEIILDGWNGTNKVIAELENRLLGFEGRFISKKTVDLTIAVIDKKYDFPADSYAKLSLIELANAYKAVTHKNNNLMTSLGLLELPEEVDE